MLSEMENGRIMVTLQTEGADQKAISVEAVNLRSATAQAITPVRDSARKETADFLRWRNSAVR